MSDRPYSTANKRSLDRVLHIQTLLQGNKVLKIGLLRHFLKVLGISEDEL